MRSSANDASFRRAPLCGLAGRYEKALLWTAVAPDDHRVTSPLIARIIRGRILARSGDLAAAARSWGRPIPANWIYLNYDRTVLERSQRREKTITRAPTKKIIVGVFTSIYT